MRVHEYVHAHYMRLVYSSSLEAGNFFFFCFAPKKYERMNEKLDSVWPIWASEINQKDLVLAKRQNYRKKFLKLAAAFIEFIVFKIFFVILLLWKHFLTTGNDGIIKLVTIFTFSYGISKRASG